MSDSPDIAVTLLPANCHMVTEDSTHVPVFAVTMRGGALIAWDRYGCPREIGQPTGDGNVTRLIMTEGDWLSEKQFDSDMGY